MKYRQKTHEDTLAQIAEWREKATEYGLIGPGIDSAKVPMTDKHMRFVIECVENSLLTLRIIIEEVLGTNWNKYRNYSVNRHELYKRQKEATRIREEAHKQAMVDSALIKVSNLVNGYTVTHTETRSFYKVDDNGNKILRRVEETLREQYMPPDTKILMRILDRHHNDLVGAVDSGAGMNQGVTILDADEYDSATPPEAGAIGGAGLAEFADDEEPSSENAPPVG